MGLWAWPQAALINLPAARKFVVLERYDAARDPVVRYHLTDAWPSKMEIGWLKSGDSLRMETVAIVCEHPERVAR